MVRGGEMKNVGGVYGCGILGGIMEGLGGRGVMEGYCGKGGGGGRRVIFWFGCDM